MQKVTPFLWFNDGVDEALKLYSSIFKNLKASNQSYYPKGSPAPEGSLMSVTIDIDGQKLILFNGGPHFQFTPAISMFVNCETQEEVDHYWDKLSEGGRTDRCGWLQDKFGLSWQIVPSKLMQYLQDKDPQKAKRTMEAMMKMTKLDIAELQRAHDQE